MKKKLTENQKNIVNSYIDLANKLGYHPSRQDLIDSGISYAKVKHYFGNYPKLTSYVNEFHPISVPNEKPVPGPKVLLLDIETAQMIVKMGVWDLKQYNPYIPPSAIIQDWTILSWAAKWLNSDEMMYRDVNHQKNLRDDKKLLKDIWRLLDEADVVVTQNGKNFDIRALNARFIINGFQPPSSFRQMDTKLINKKHFRFPSHSLEYMSKALNLKHQKLTHGKFPGITLWNECLKRNQEAWAEMQEYNKWDVLSLEDLYNKVVPWDSTDFSVYYNQRTCKCGNTQFQKNGFHYTNKGKFQRHKCIKCGSELRDSNNLLKSKNK